MKILVITSSPNKDGLTAACGKAAEEGARNAGAEVITVSLNDLNVSKCHACNNSWGTCLEKHECQVKDDFQKLHALMADMDAYVVVTPVYWGEMSESAKAFFDRLRRNEATKERGSSILHGKFVIPVAAAGGSGGGLLTCLTSMEGLFRHMQADIFDMIGITRKSRNYKLEAIRAAVKEMASYQKG